MYIKAVAIKYDDTTDIPLVVAKGKENMALSIIQKAKEFSIPIFQNKELADSLMNIEIDDFINEENYLAVAKVLIWLHENEHSVELSKQ